MTGFAEIAAAGPVLAALGVSVLAGLVSFASPCVVPLVPGYLSYLAAVVGVEEEPGLGAGSEDTGVAVRTARLRVDVTGKAARDCQQGRTRGAPEGNCARVDL